MHSTYFISLIQIDTKLIQRSKFTSLGRNLFVLVVHLSITFSISIPHFIEKYFLNKLQRHLFYATERIFSTLMGHPKGERERERRVVSKSGLEFHFLLSAKCCLRRRRRRLRHRMLTPSCRFWSSKKRERKKIINLGKKEKGHLKKANAKAQSKDNLKFGFGCLLFIDSDLSWHHTVAYWDCLV